MENPDLIAGIVAVLLAVAGWLKSHSEVDDVKKDREATRKSRDTEIALLNARTQNIETQLMEYKATTDKRLTEGDEFMNKMSDQLSELNGNVSFIVGLLKGREQLESILKETNKNISELLNVMKSATRAPSHTPEDRPI